MGGTSQKLQLKLLVTSVTSEEQRGVLVKQIALLHPTQEETDVTVLVWDGTDSPHSFAGRGIRLYAASAVSEMQTTNAAVVDWQRNWRIIPGNA